MALKPLELSKMPWLRDPGGTRSQPMFQDTQKQKEPVALGEGGQHPGRASRRERSLLPQGHRAPGPGDTSPLGPCCEPSHRQGRAVSMLLPGKRLGQEGGRSTCSQVSDSLPSWHL